MLACQAAEELLLIHAVLESLMSVDEDDWNLVIKLTPQAFIGVHVDLAPLKAAAAVEFDEALLHHLA
jgi:hypothetical protein